MEEDNDVTEEDNDVTEEENSAEVTEEDKGNEVKEEHKESSLFKWLQVGVIIILLLVIVGLNFKKSEVHWDDIKGKPEQGAPFCVQWENMYRAEELIAKCYNFKTRDITCTWLHQGNGSVTLVDKYNTSNVQQTLICTKYSPSFPMNAEVFMDRATSLEWGVENE